MSYTKYFSAWACLVSIILCSCSSKQARFIKITNPLNIERADELVVLKRADIESQIGKIPCNKYARIIAGDKSLPAQYDDMNGDGVWDELVFLYSFKAGESANLKVALSDTAPEDNNERAHVRHRKKNADDNFGPVITKDTMPPGNKPTDFSKVLLPPYLTEGPAWENDKVAFRLYFDTRNGKDVFGKLVPGMVTDTIGANSNNSYHEFSHWGMDILHVGKSLGAGAVAIKTKDKNGKDTLIRLGGKDVKKETYEVVADGPVRAVFRINYQWEINGKPVEITDETSIWGGQYFYETKLNVTKAPADFKLAVGIADFYNNEKGQLDTAGTTVYYSYGTQSENKDNLGLAIAVLTPGFNSPEIITDTLSDIQNTSAVLLNYSADKPMLYRFYAGWEKSDERFKNQEAFTEFLKAEGIKFGNPVITN